MGKKLNSNQLIKITLYTLSRIILLLFLFIVLFISIPDSSYTFNNYSTPITFKRLAPEGWAFFTRDPREMDFNFFPIKNGNVLENENFPICSFKNFFGIKRNPKAIDADLISIVNEIPQLEWQSVNSLEIKDLQNVDKIFHKVKNPFPFPLITDSICIVSYKPLPWAWSKLTPQNSNEGNCIFLIVE